MLSAPFPIVRVKDLREAAPPDVTHQNGFVLRCCGALLVLDGAQRLDRGEIVAKLLFETAFTQPIAWWMSCKFCGKPCSDTPL